MKTFDPVMIARTGDALGITNLAAFRAGVEDGFEQGEKLSMGLSYDDEDDQWAYDTGTRIGACLKVR